MKWPWVSREWKYKAEMHEQHAADWRMAAIEWCAASEKHEANAKASRDALHEAAEANRAVRAVQDPRYDALLEKFTALRLAGAVVPEPVPLPIERKRDPCAEAILAKAGRDTALQTLMFEQLSKDRAAGKNETEILRAIQTGEAPDPWTMPA